MSIDRVKTIFELLKGDRVDVLKSMNIIDYLPRDTKASQNLAIEFRDHLKRYVIAGGYGDKLELDSELFCQAAAYMNGETAEWFVNEVDLHWDLSNKPLRYAFSKTNMPFIRWYLNKYLEIVKDIHMMEIISFLIIYFNTIYLGWDNQFMGSRIDMLNRLVAHGDLQHYRIIALELAVNRGIDSAAYYVLRNCDFTDAEIESIEGLPDKFRPLGPKHAYY